MERIGHGGRMSIVAADREVCAVCSRDAGLAGPCFCHFYPRGERVSLCTPACAEVYLARLAPAPSAEGDLRREWGEAVAFGPVGSDAPPGPAFPM